MTHHIDTLADRFLAHFLTIRFTRFEPVWTFLVDDMPPDAHARCLEHAERCEELLVRCHRFNLRQDLLDNGYSTFTDRVEGVVGDEWRIHLFLADDGAARLVPNLIDGEVGAGNPMGFDPTSYIQWKVERVKNKHRITGRYDWLDDDLP